MQQPPSKSPSGYSQRLKGATPPRQASGLIWRGVLLFILVLVAVLGWRSWRAYSLAQELRTDLRTIRSLSSSVDSSTIATLAPVIARSRATAAALHAEAALFFPLTNHLGWVPTYGSDLVAAEPLLTAAKHATVAADESLTILTPLLDTFEATENLASVDLETVTEQLAAVRPQLETAQAASAKALRAWQQMPAGEELDPRLATYVQWADTLLPLLDAGLTLGLAGEELATILVPIIGELDGAAGLEDVLHLALLEQVTAARPQIEALQPELAEALSKWQQIDVAALPSSLQVRIQQINALIPLLAVSDELIIAIDETAAAVRPVLGALDRGQPFDAVVTNELVAVRPQLVQASSAMEALLLLWEQIPRADLPAVIQARLAPLDRLLPLAASSLQLAQVAPELLGVAAPQDYLFIAQNPDELRATGGFISAAGIVTFEDGQLTDFNVHDSDGFVPGEYPLAPAPFAALNINILVFRDANWSPDLPTAAQTLFPLYEQKYGRQAQNLVAFTPTALQYLLEATGPVVPADSQTAVSAETLPEYIIAEYDRGLDAGINRKAFLGPLMDVIVDRVQNEPETFDWHAIAQALLRAFEQRHLLVFMSQPEAAAILAQQGWDGSVRPGDQDFLMVVDSNLGYSKANYYIQQTIDYQIDLSDTNAPVATVTVRDTHQLNQPQPCPHWREYEAIDYSPDPTLSNYALATDRCYWSYQRVLVPGDSQLLGVQTTPVPVEWGVGDIDDGSVRVAVSERGTRTFGGFVIVPPGGVRETSYRYRLPISVVQQEGDSWTYTLNIQRQPGRETVPIRVIARLPAGVVVTDLSQPPVAITNAEVEWSLTLEQDRVLTLSFAPQQPQGQTP